MNEIKEYTEKMLDDIKHIDEFGNEYWLARELHLEKQLKSGPIRDKNVAVKNGIEKLI